MLLIKSQTKKKKICNHLYHTYMEMWRVQHISLLYLYIYSIMFCIFGFKTDISLIFHCVEQTDFVNKSTFRERFRNQCLQTDYILRDICFKVYWQERQVRSLFFSKVRPPPLNRIFKTAACQKSHHFLPWLVLMQRDLLYYMRWW